MYSWMPKLWTLRSKCSAAAMQTGLRSVAPWRAGAHLIQLRERRDLAQVADAAGVHHRRPDVVDELLLDQLLAVVDRVEDLADRERRRRVLADEAEAFLSSRPASDPPSRTGGTARGLAQPRRFDRRQPVVHVVQQMDVGAELARAGARTAAARTSRYVSLLHTFSGGRPALGRLVVQLAAADAVGAGRDRARRTARGSAL